VRGVLAKSFARIHRANLINNGILPLEFETEADYDRFAQDDELALPDVRALVEAGEEWVPVANRSKGFSVRMKLALTERQRKMILAGGLINMIAEENR
ncbi:MAG: aconitate hydratase, partial [Clostridia bacterium]